MRYDRILFVDDEPAALNALRRMLHDHRREWDMRFVRSVDEALAELRQDTFDAVVADIRMPGRDGFDLLTAIQSDAELQQIPVIMVSGLDERTLKRSALEMGAADLLSKPVQREELLARIRSALRLKRYHDEIRTQNAALERIVAERTRALEHSRLDLIWTLASAAEQRDGITGSHVLRVAAYSRALAQTMALDDGFVEMLTLASPLHDVGKIGIPDRVLKKPGPLTERERALMRRHCAIGARILSAGAAPSALERVWLKGASAAAQRPEAAAPNALLQLAASIALTHHERWDGSGYPHGRRGDEIPLESRIVSVADVYDALRSERSYKPAYSEARSLEMIRDQCGQAFDPRVCAALDRSLEALRTIADEFADGAGEFAAA